MLEEAARGATEARDIRALLGSIVDATPSALVVLDPAHRSRASQPRRRGRTRAGPGGAPSPRRPGRVRDEVRRVPRRPRRLPTARRRPARVRTPTRGPARSWRWRSHPLDLPDGRRHVLLVERIVTEQKKPGARLRAPGEDGGVLALGRRGRERPRQPARVDRGAASAPGRDAPRRAGRRHGDGPARRWAGWAGSSGSSTLRPSAAAHKATLVSVQAVTEDALRLPRHDRRARNVTVETSFDPRTPPVKMVEDHLMQVVLNLLLERGRRHARRRNSAARGDAPWR